MVLRRRWRPGGRHGRTKQSGPPGPAGRVGTEVRYSGTLVLSRGEGRGHGVEQGSLEGDAHDDQKATRSRRGCSRRAPRPPSRRARRSGRRRSVRGHLEQGGTPRRPRRRAPGTPGVSLPTEVRRTRARRYGVRSPGPARTPADVGTCTPSRNSVAHPWEPGPVLVRLGSLEQHPDGQGLVADVEREQHAARREHQPSGGSGSRRKVTPAPATRAAGPDRPAGSDR